MLTQNRGGRRGSTGKSDGTSIGKSIVWSVTTGKRGSDRRENGSSQGKRERKGPTPIRPLPSSPL
jgi:hypothetical protein